MGGVYQKWDQEEEAGEVGVLAIGTWAILEDCKRVQLMDACFTSFCFLFTE